MAVISSPYPALNIPRCNLLDYLFAEIKDGSDPLWIDAETPTECVSVNDTLSLIRRFGAGCEKLGVAKDASIMVISPNQICVPIIYLATAGTGRIYTAANPSYTVQELAHQMKAMQPGLLLVHPGSLSNALKAAQSAGTARDRIFAFSPRPLTNATAQTQGVSDWRSMLAPEKDSRQWRWPTLSGNDSDRTAVVNFSSGTTGLPKGVCISHHNIVANASQIIHAHFADGRATRSARWLVYLPWYHAYAQTFSIVVACKLRSRVFVMPRFKLEDYVVYMQRHRITTLQVVPPTLVSLSKRQSIRDNVGNPEETLNTVEYVMSAAAPLKSAL